MYNSIILEQESKVQLELYISTWQFHHPRTRKQGTGGTVHKQMYNSIILEQKSKVQLELYISTCTTP
jgi:hypothetical protein